MSNTFGFTTDCRRGVAVPYRRPARPLESKYAQVPAFPAASRRRLACRSAASPDSSPLLASATAVRSTNSFAAWGTRVATHQPRETNHVGVKGGDANDLP